MSDDLLNSFKNLKIKFFKNLFRAWCFFGQAVLPKLPGLKLFCYMTFNFFFKWRGYATYFGIPKQFWKISSSMPKIFKGWFLFSDTFQDSSHYQMPRPSEGTFVFKNLSNLWYKFLWTTLILVIVCCCFLFHSSSKKSKLKWKVVILNFCVVLKLSWIFSVSHFFKRSKIKDSGPLFVLILPVCWNAPLKIYVLDLLIYT